LLCALLLFCIAAFLRSASLLCYFVALPLCCFVVLLHCTVANILDYLLAYSLRIKAFDLSNYTQFFTKKP